jgi:hypothetical protein
MSAATPEPTSENLHFKEYLLENVYLRTIEAQRAEILAFWRNEGAGLEGSHAERTSHEAVYLVRANSGELAGVSTVALVRLKDGRRFYSMSLFLRKQDQAIPYLGITVSDATRDFLRKFKHPVAQPAGVLNVNENPRLMRPGVRKLFKRHGYQYWGQTANGEDVWVTEFDEAKQVATSPSAAERGVADNGG